MSHELLKNIYYGNEINDPKGLMSWSRKVFPGLTEDQFTRIQHAIVEYFSNVKSGIFGGPITAGDASVIATLMEHVRPVQMLEFGVASGWSSAFILSYARRAGLSVENGVFLHSFDLCKEHKPGQRVGSYLTDHHGSLAANWDLNTEVTSATLLREDATLAIRTDGPVLAFVDAGHNHPWPLLDLVYLYKYLPRGSWVVLQDVQMMERWIADCIIHNVPSPAPVRGVNLALGHWPGTKLMGFDMAYNSAALCLDIPDWQFRGYVQEMCRYPHEIAFDHNDLLV